MVSRKRHGKRICQRRRFHRNFRNLPLVSTSREMACSVRIGYLWLPCIVMLGYWLLLSTMELGLTGTRGQFSLLVSMRFILLSVVIPHEDCCRFLQLLQALSTSFCCGSFRKRLFNMMNELPTVFDVVTGKKPVKDKPAFNKNSGTKAKSAMKLVSVGNLLLTISY